MKTKTLKIITGILTAVTTLALLDFSGGAGRGNDVHLQSPSLVYATASGPNRYANAKVMTREEEEAAERLAEEADSEEDADKVRSENPEVFNLDDYTITAPANYEEIAQKVRGEEDPGEQANQENYDGKYVWTKDNLTKVYALPNTSAKVLVNYRRGSKLIRISYTGEWSYIRLKNGNKGYVLSKCVSSKKVSTPTPTPKPQRYYTPQPKKNCVYATCSLNTRSGPGLSYSKISTLKTGTEIVVASKTNGWIKSDKGWYVKADLCVNYPLTASGKKATPTPTPKPSAAQLRYMRLSGFARYVSGFVGCRYVYGGSSPSGFDCSGFSMYCYAKYYNIHLPHGANMQMHRGKKVSLSALHTGDLIFFDHDHNGKADHVGIYVGGGKMVHASNARTGVIKVSLSGKKDIIAARRFI
ncbi:MAG: hypothetical protein E7386_08095 [Ruminococcaceae bacterium]|nr:hypothetical protein [Oscillospiraceae bacterium]